MAATAMVQSKIEPRLKATVEKYFAEFGIDTSTAIRMFLMKVAQTRSIPFRIGMEAEPSFEPTGEFGAFLDNAEEDIKHGLNLLSFKTNKAAIAHLEKLVK